MPFLNIFRNLFGAKNPEEPQNDRFSDHWSYEDRFRNPIWQSDEDDDDIEDFRYSRNGRQFRIFSDPLEMTRFFESQMDSILKDFFFDFGNGGVFSMPGDNLPALPYEAPKQESLRDKFLKSDFDAKDQGNQEEQKYDADLDGQIDINEFSKAFGSQNNTAVQPFNPSQHSTGMHVRKQFVYRSDGAVEQKEIFRDSNGNETTVISRQIGDKKYTVTTKKDRNGVETKTEDIVNMDENELQNFTQKWELPDSTNKNNHNSILSQIPWDKFFGPSPRL